MAFEVKGGLNLRDTKDRLHPFSSTLLGQQITIIRFKPPSKVKHPIKLAQYKAARFSTEHKVKTFAALGCKVKDLYLDSSISQDEFRELLTEANQTSVGVIVQNPFPKDFRKELSAISYEKDIDGLREDNPFFPVSATSETIFRLVEPFIEDSDIVAVVGSKGFVGSGVCKLLNEKGVTTLGLDYGDDLLQTRNANIVVSATGVPELLDERHLVPEHRLVVDAGFVPLADSPILGDVNRSAYDIPKSITPVPGGVGPFQMATLMERLVTQVTGKEIERWQCPIPFEKEQSIPQKSRETPEQIWERYHQSLNINEPSERIQAFSSQMFLDGINPEIAKAVLLKDPSLRELQPDQARKIATQTIDQAWEKMDLKMTRLLTFARKLVGKKGERVGKDQIFKGKNYLFRQSRTTVSIEAKGERGVILSGNEKGYTLSGFSRNDLQRFDRGMQRARDRQAKKARSRADRQTQSRDSDFGRD